MLKKALIATAVLAASTGIAFANGGSFQPAPPQHTGSFYIGAGISRDIGTFDVKQPFAVVVHKDPNMIDGGEIIQGTNHFDSLGGDGINGELYGGYGITFLNHYYIGIEGFGAISSLDADATLNSSVPITQRGPNASNVANVTTNYKVESDWNAGVSLMPGIKVTDNTLLYGRVGWKYADFDVKSSSSASWVNNAGKLKTANWSSKGNEGLNGIELGVGMEAMVTQNIGVRGEWDWNRFEDMKALGLEPTIDNFTFGVDYHFH